MRSASVCAHTNVVIVSFSIHSDIIAKRVSSIVAPNNGSMFGWRRDFHVTTSSQNLCIGHGQFIYATSGK